MVVRACLSGWHRAYVELAGNFREGRKKHMCFPGPPEETVSCCCFLALETLFATFVGAGGTQLLFAPCVMFHWYMRFLLPTESRMRLKVTASKGRRHAAFQVQTMSSVMTEHGAIGRSRQGSASTLETRQASRITTADAISLHSTIPAHCWCVTRADLRFLQQEVRRAMLNGEIQPPANGVDDFLISDQRYGPSVYTVNEQHIKPVTERAGKISWALMRHPQGLTCDLFVSHAWQEGIFELLSKLLHSWPRWARHAWCCMLANPQNLDIGSLLQSPRRSPFAQAIQVASHVLVVPNRHISIYTRLWCGYEAHLAQEQRKLVLIARPSNGREIGRALCCIFCAAVVGLVLGYVSQLATWTVVLNPAGLVVAAIAAGWSIAYESNACRIALNLLGQTVCWFLVVNWGPHPHEGSPFPIITEPF